MKDYKITAYTIYGKPEIEYVDDRQEAFSEFLKDCKEMTDILTVRKITLHVFDHIDNKYKLIGKLEKW